MKAEGRTGRSSSGKKVKIERVMRQRVIVIVENATKKSEREQRKSGIKDNVKMEKRA